MQYELSQAEHMRVIVFMDHGEREMVEAIVELRRRIEGDIARGRRRGESKAELTLFVRQIDISLATICKHVIIEDEIELVKGFEPRLEKIRFCEICALPASKCGA